MAKESETISTVELVGLAVAGLGWAEAIVELHRQGHGIGIIYVNDVELATNASGRPVRKTESTRFLQNVPVILTSLVRRPEAEFASIARFDVERMGRSWHV